MSKIGNKSRENVLNKIKLAIKAGRRRDYLESIKILSSLAPMAEEYPEILLYLGRSYHALGEITNAIKLLQYYLKLKPESDAGYFFLGRSYFANNQYRKAILFLKKAIELNSRVPFVYGLLGLAYLKLKRYNLAVTIFKQAMDMVPWDNRFISGYYNSLLLLAIKLFYTGAFQESVNVFLEVLDKYPGNTTANLFLSIIFKDMKKYEFALFHINKVLKNFPDDPKLHLNKASILMAMENRRDAIAELKFVAKSFNANAVIPGQEDELNRLLATILFKEKNYKQAILYGTKLLKKNFKQPEIHALIAEAYRNLGDYEKSRNHYERAVEEKKEVVEFRYGLLVSLWQLKDYQGAYREVKKILLINPHDELARYYYSLIVPRVNSNHRENIRLIQEQIRKFGPDVQLMKALGDEYVNSGLYELAEGWFLRCLKIVPEEKEIYEKLADVYKHLEERGKIVNIYTDFLLRFPDELATRKSLIKELLSQGSFENALVHILYALSYEPNNTKLKEALAFSYKNLKRYTDAIIVYSELLKSRPDNIEYLINLTTSMLKVGSIDRATKMLEKALKYFKGSNLNLKKLLGYCYYKRGDYESSSALFREVLSINSNDWQAYQGLANVYRKTNNTAFYRKFSQKARELKEKQK